MDATLIVLLMCSFLACCITGGALYYYKYYYKASSKSMGGTVKSKGDKSMDMDDMEHHMGSEEITDSKDWPAAGIGTLRQYDPKNVDLYFGVVMPSATADQKVALQTLSKQLNSNDTVRRIYCHEIVVNNMGSLNAFLSKYVPGSSATQLTGLQDFSQKLNKSEDFRLTYCHKVIDPNPPQGHMKNWTIDKFLKQYD